MRHRRYDPVRAIVRDADGRQPLAKIRMLAPHIDQTIN